MFVMETETAAMAEMKKIAWSTLTSTYLKLVSSSKVLRKKCSESAWKSVLKNVLSQKDVHVHHFRTMLPTKDVCWVTETFHLILWSVEKLGLTTVSITLWTTVAIGTSGQQPLTSKVCDWFQSILIWIWSKSRSIKNGEVFVMMVSANQMHMSYASS